jgi:hypothetical protein
MGGCPEDDELDSNVCFEAGIITCFTVDSCLSF